MHPHRIWKCEQKYFMRDTIFGKSVKEKDLGVIVSSDMTVPEQCRIASSNGNQIFGLIRSNKR